MTDLCTALVKGEYNRFHQRGCTSYFCEEDMFRYPQLTGSDGEKTFDISPAVKHHGVQTKTLISSNLFSTWICSGTVSVERNIATLCHAFLYTVDLDVDESSSLEFAVPFFLKTSGLTPVSVRARLKSSGKTEHIIFELTTE